jgi:hypothetical protein
MSKPCDSPFDGPEKKPGYCVPLPLEAVQTGGWLVFGLVVHHITHPPRQYSERLLDDSQSLLVAGSAITFDDMYSERVIIMTLRNQGLHRLHLCKAIVLKGEQRSDCRIFLAVAFAGSTLLHRTGENYKGRDSDTLFHVCASENHTCVSALR